MKVLTWKAVLSTLNPSPIFVAVARLRRSVGDERRWTLSKEVESPTGERLVKEAVFQLPRQNLLGRFANVASSR
jgi:hypothetical protein